MNMSEQSTEYNMDWNYTSHVTSIWATIQKGKNLDDYYAGMLYAIETLMQAPAAAMTDEACNLLEEIEESLNPIEEKPKVAQICTMVERKPMFEDVDISDEEMLEILDERA
jgi:hypothetical protein